MAAYYNENDPQKAAWLRELIKADVIAPGEVDERSIEDVIPNELAGFTQCHFFAGIGIWSYALRCAEWPDDRAVWTGSCPCQPFSSAGKGEGFDDERHLWPALYHLISIGRPDVFFGEQVASKDGLAWLDLVQDDLEAAAYAVGALNLPACGFGAPHRRQRLFFVADSNSSRQMSRSSQSEKRNGHSFVAGCGQLGDMANSLRSRRQEGRVGSRSRQAARSGEPGALADPAQLGCERPAGHIQQSESVRNGEAGSLGNSEGNGRIRRANDGDGGRRECPPGQAGEIGGLDNAISHGRGASRDHNKRDERIVSDSDGQLSILGDPSSEGLEIGFLPDGRLGPIRIKGPAAAETGIVSGFWEDADIILCNDEDGWKWRAVEPGTFPLAYGTPARVLRLRGFGDGIVAPAAEAFIAAYMELKDHQ